MFSRNLLILLLCSAMLGLSACGSRYLDSRVLHEEARIRNTPENTEILEMMERYEAAVDDLDLETLSEMVSRDYYENNGTTHTAEDDYGYEGVIRLFESLADHVLDTRVDIQVRDLRVYGERADVVFEYAYTTLYDVDGNQRWQTERDINRIQLQREGDLWRIISGL